MNKRLKIDRYHTFNFFLGKTQVSWEINLENFVLSSQTILTGVKSVWCFLWIRCTHPGLCVYKNVYVLYLKEKSHNLSKLNSPLSMRMLKYSFVQPACSWWLPKRGSSYSHYLPGSGICAENRMWMQIALLWSPIVWERSGFLRGWDTSEPRPSFKVY